MLHCGTALLLYLPLPSPSPIKPPTMCPPHPTCNPPPAQHLPPPPPPPPALKQVHPALGERVCGQRARVERVQPQAGGGQGPEQAPHPGGPRGQLGQGHPPHQHPVPEWVGRRGRGLLGGGEGHEHPVPEWVGGTQGEGCVGWGRGGEGREGEGRGIPPINILFQRGLGGRGRGVWVGVWGGGEALLASTPRSRVG